MSHFRYTPRTFARECLMVLIGLAWLIPFFLLINISAEAGWLRGLRLAVSAAVETDLQ